MVVVAFDFYEVPFNDCVLIWFPIWIEVIVLYYYIANLFDIYKLSVLS